MRKTYFPKLFFNSGYCSISATAMDPQKMMLLVLLVVNLLVSPSEGSSSTLETRSHSNFIPTENSNLEVLKELGVDIQSEGRTYVFYYTDNKVKTGKGSSTNAVPQFWTIIDPFPTSSGRHKIMLRPWRHLWTTPKEALGV